MITFRKGERKDDIAKEYLARFTGQEGILFVGKVQRRLGVSHRAPPQPVTGQTYPWIVRSTAMVNHHYYYYAIFRREAAPAGPNAGWTPTLAPPDNPPLSEGRNPCAEDVSSEPLRFALPHPGAGR